MPAASAGTPRARTDFHDGISRYSAELAAAVVAAAPERGVDVVFLIHESWRVRMSPSRRPAEPIVCMGENTASAR
jgi:hypothetical protein